MNNQTLVIGTRSFTDYGYGEDFTGDENQISVEYFNDFLSRITDPEKFQLEGFIENIGTLVNKANNNLTNVKEGLTIKNVTFFGYPFHQDDNHAVSFCFAKKLSSSDDQFKEDGVRFGVECICVEETDLMTDKGRSVLVPSIMSVDEITNRVNMYDNDVDTPLVCDGYIKHRFEGVTNYHPLLISGHFHKDDGSVLNIGETLGITANEATLRRSPGVLISDNAPSFVKEIKSLYDSFLSWNSTVSCVNQIPIQYLLATGQANTLLPNTSNDFSSIKKNKFFSAKPFYSVASFDGESVYWLFELTTPKRVNDNISSDRLSILLDVETNKSVISSGALYRLSQGLNAGYDMINDLVTVYPDIDVLSEKNLDFVIDAVKSCICKSNNESSNCGQKHSYTF